MQINKLMVEPHPCEITQIIPYHLQPSAQVLTPFLFTIIPKQMTKPCLTYLSSKFPLEQVKLDLKTTKEVVVKAHGGSEFCQPGQISYGQFRKECQEIDPE
jgi:hypothetical protein